MTTAKKSDRYLNMDSGALVEVLDEPAGGRCMVGTLAPTGEIKNKRRVHCSELKDSYLDDGGRPWKVGYVRLDGLPGGHPYKPVEATPFQIPAEDPDFEAMDTATLAACTNRHKVLAKMHKNQGELAEGELASRQKNAGVFVYGDTAVVLTSKKRFDPELAEKLLRPEEYALICEPKPSAARAQKLFKGNPERFEELRADKGLGMEVRIATDEDRIAAKVREESMGLYSGNIDA